MPLHEHTAHRRRLPQAVLTGFVAVGLALVGASPALAAPTTSSVTVTATPTTSTVGGVIDVQVGLLGAVDVYAYEVTITFDPSLLSYVGGSATAPAGGFDSVTGSAGSVTLVHSRLGSSPALAGDILVGLQFTALGSGSAVVSVSTVTLVDPESVSATQSDAGSATVLIEAVDPEPPGGGGDPSAPPAPTDGGPLATTGFAMGGVLLLVASIALGVGVLLVLRRRRAGTR